MKSYFYRYIRSKKSLLIAGLMVLFPIIDLFLLNSQWQDKFTINQSLFLVGHTEGHMMQILFLWFLPIYLLIMVSEYYIQDVSSGSNTVQIVKVGKKKYFTNQLLFSFLVAFTVMLLALLVNLALVSLINYSGAYDPNTSSLGLYRKYIPQHPELAYGYFMLTHQTLANLISILLVSFLSGVTAVGLTALCFLFPKRVYAYFLGFALWFLIITGKHALLAAFNPFTDRPWTQLLTNVLLFLSSVAVLTLISLIYKVKSDEL
jgi:hypothetical protein